jgi:hypothetical protein
LEKLRKLVKDPNLMKKAGSDAERKRDSAQHQE